MVSFNGATPPIMCQRFTLVYLWFRINYTDISNYPVYPRAYSFVLPLRFVHIPIQ